MNDTRLISSLVLCIGVSMGESQKSLHLLVQLERQQCPSTIESSEKERSMDRGEDRGDGHLSVGLSLTR